MTTFDKGYTTTDPAEFDVQFIAGFGQLLDAAVTEWKWGTFAPTDVGIVSGGLPSSPPDAIALMSYQVSDDPELADSVLGLQVTTRGAAAGADTRPTDRLSARVYDQLHGLTNVALPGGVYVVQCLRQSATSLGQDDNQRWRTVQNFYVTVHRPSKYRI